MSTDSSASSKPSFTVPDWAKKPRNLLIAGAALLVVIFLIVWWAIGNHVTNVGNQKEADLVAAYNDGAHYLSNCVVKTNQAANVAQGNAAAFDKVIKDAIAGNGAFHTDTAKTSTGLFPLLVQAYPNLNGQTDLYKKVADIIVGCQDDFRAKQSAVLDQVRSFNRWRTGSWTVRHFGSDFPNDNLVINLPGVQPLTGKAALLKMGQPIIDATTSGSYQTGQQSTQGPFPGSSPSK